MNYRRFIAIFATVAVLAAIVCFLLPTARPAVHVSTCTIVIDEIERSYRVALPDDLPEPCAVVFAFHGIGDSADSMATYSQLDRLASDQDFLLVYPTGLNAAWAASDVNPETFDANPDVRFFDALLEYIAAQHTIDRKRIYLIGMSNGASFVQLLGTARSSDVAAVVARSGPRPRTLMDAQQPFPILLIVGGDDSASGSVQSDLEYYQAAGHDAELIVVRGLGHEWSIRHNADAWTFMADRRRSP